MEVIIIIIIIIILLVRQVSFISHGGGIHTPNWLVSSMCFVAKQIHPTAKVSDEVNRKLPARNTTV